MCYVVARPMTDHIESTTRRVKSRVYVDSELMARWQDRHGGYASLSWLLETAMRQVLTITESEPSLGEVVEAGIKAHIKANHFNPRKPRADIAAQP
jgi:hypothetical protein